MTKKNFTHIIEQAKIAEAQGELKKAAELYELAIHQKPLDELPYTRLMILYRKLKNPRQELEVINKGLKAFIYFFEKKEKPFKGRDPVGRLSKALLKSLTGSAVKKSYTQYPEPVPKWTIRKKAVEHKL